MLPFLSLELPKGEVLHRCWDPLLKVPNISIIKIKNLRKMLPFLNLWLAKSELLPPLLGPPFESLT